MARPAPYLQYPPAGRGRHHVAGDAGVEPAEERGGRHIVHPGARQAEGADIGDDPLERGAAAVEHRCAQNGDREDPESFGHLSPQLWWWYSCTTACPLPRAMSQRLTGKAATKATTRENARLPQKSMFVRPASIAPGMTTITRLSTISMIVIESVSEANARGSTVASANPERRSGSIVSE